ncbi:hypothetical protein K503DRAFT_420176 [Rhizopogon vinicolor AM-OR11-026]|uniref:Heterokaryon incompatibility domain-containing protein n=1 Tax=Rhizopogon vinicolor AM-OR11-026 TaxID=1314800 RepID=A0A1B7MQ77_9AGAM|nr:hypothetical protein K503DRAFT_420176 [Rhizopogon vinicolor AM-OR11-026]
MANVPQPIKRITTPCRELKDHQGDILAVAVFPQADEHRMVTASYDKTLRLWDLKDGVVLKKMRGHHGKVETVAVSRDGQFIASGDLDGEFIAWNGGTGEPLTKTIKVHSKQIETLDFSPDGAVLATGSWDKMTKLWSTKTWDVQGNPIGCDADVNCVRFSPSGEQLAIATKNNIQIWNPYTRESIAKFKSAITPAWNFSLAWTPDGTRLLSGGSTSDPTIREWDTLTWQQVGDPWSGHSGQIHSIAVSPTGGLVASASQDSHVRLWCLSDRRAIAMFKASNEMYSVSFSMDGKHILCGGKDMIITEWAVPGDALQRALEDHAMNKILPVNMTVRNACIIGDLPTAEKILTEEIRADGNNYSAYANNSFVVARKGDWDNALRDALKSVSIQPSLTGYIAKGIALCGKMQFKEAMKAFDLAFMFGGDPQTIHILLLIKAVALFNANQHKDAMLRIQELASACPDADTLTCRVVEAYLNVQLGVNSLNDAHHDEAADNFTAAIDTGVLSSQLAIRFKYEVFAVLFGWDLKSSWQTANQQRCRALLLAGRLAEAHESYRYTMDTSDDATKVRCLEWSTAFKQQCNALYAASGVVDPSASGDAAFAANEYDRAIELYSAAINLDSATDIIFSNRCKAKLNKMLWEDALLDAKKVIGLSPSSYLGYELKHAALHGMRQYDEAIEAFEIMLSKLNDSPDIQIRQLCQQYVSRSEAEGDVRRITDDYLENVPHRLINTSTGHLCDQQAQIHAFETSAGYKELVSSMMKYGSLRSERIQNVVLMFFQYAMLSHRWEGQEPLLHDIQGKSVYELDPVDGIAKLKSFCKVARDAGYHWAWSDTCCIDKNSNIDVQKSVNSMFVWYRHSALTIIYLSDVLPSSKSGALAKSVWNSRGWTVQEFLAPKVVLFYQKDWTLYLDDRSPNHKECDVIMRELEAATGINAQALVDFRLERRGAREKLQWSAKRVTTFQEDIAYSLFGIFGVHLYLNYGENKQNALGRLLQEIIAHSGDISCLEWIGKSSEFHSCLPANITSYGAPPFPMPSLSKEEMQTSVSSLRDAGAANLASQLYTGLEYLTAPRFAQRRLHLPCIVFRVTEVKPKPGQERGSYITYEVKAKGLCDLLVTTEDRLVAFSPANPTRRTFFLVHPWDRNLLELQDFAELPNHAYRAQNMDDYWSPPSSPLDDSYGRSIESHLRLIVHLGQPFSALLLAAQQWRVEYKRIASDCNIIAQVKDADSVCDLMDVRVLEIV